MELKEKNAIVAHYFEELTFRAKRIGFTITNIELTDALGYADSSTISKWAKGKGILTEEKLNEVMAFIASKEQIVGRREILNGLRELIAFLNKE